MNETWSVNKIIIVTLSSFLIMAVLAGIISLFAVNHNRVIKGVTYMGQDISGMTKEEISDFFAREGRQRAKKITIIMQYGDNSWSIEDSEIGLVANAEEAASRAYNIGRNNGFLQNFMVQMEAISKRKSIKLTAKYDEERLKAKLLKIKAAIDTQPVNAKVTLHSNGMITKTNGVVGKNLEIEPIIEKYN